MSREAYLGVESTKFEARNPRQIPNANFQVLKTRVSILLVGDIMVGIVGKGKESLVPRDSKGYLVWIPAFGGMTRHKFVRGPGAEYLFVEVIWEVSCGLVGLGSGKSRGSGSGCLY